ncbi:hypothetical protein CGLO_08391 [Colletotrichum gloeosporioides Cg-14]|uniref:Alpha/beta hydrolase fold-3 domain-containing protein n=1 Tax=Colletotrichum gloeosporioides (strain Cg-14) TaxID=1237896 RepID=T0LUQ1_COLGC|nr:hypothetical protein CGLO_08391 [Colletotrichum gloeosporioides Cg-14]
MGGTRKIYQPIHPSVRKKLDPEYVALHDSIIQFIEPSEAQPWDPSSRFNPNPLAHAMQTLSQVDVRCVVITINYRHAPEHVYPAAVDDCLTGLRWVLEPANASRLSINTSLLTIGGLSAGGSLAAVLTMKASLENVTPAPVSQILICPVIDSTTTVETVWSASKHVPWLTPGRMTWYQNLYFPNQEDKESWDASPFFAPKDIVGRSPKTWIAIAEIDLLAPEGLKYAEQLKDAGVEVETKVYKGATHSVLILAGIHQISQQLVHDACRTLAEGFGSAYDPALAPIYPQNS